MASINRDQNVSHLDDVLLTAFRKLAFTTAEQDTAILNLIETLTKNVITLTDLVSKQGDRIAVLEHELLLRTK